MRISLRAFILVFTLIAIHFGSRESIRQYHWHRNMPVAYQSGFKASAGFPSEIKVVFKRDLADSVGEQAVLGRQQLAKSIFQDHLQADSFFLEYPEEEGFSGVGLTTVGKYVTRHALPSSSKYPLTYPESVKSYVRDQTKARFLTNPGVETAIQLRLLAFWLTSEDPDAGDWVVSKLNGGSLQERTKLLTFLSDHNFLLSHENVIWLASHPHFEKAVINGLGDQKALDMAATKLCQLFQLADSVAVFSERLQSSPASLDKLSADQKVAHIANQLNWLMAWVSIQADGDSFRVLEKFGDVVSQLHLTYGVRPFQRRATVFDERIEALGWRFKDVLRTFCESTHGQARSQAALLAYRLNAMNLFLQFADRTHHPEVQTLFEGRKQLAYEKFYFDYYATNYGAIEEKRDQLTLAALPNPVSGLEERFLISLLPPSLMKLDPEFSRSQMLQLMRERVVSAYEYCGQLFHGDSEPQVVELLVAELSRSKDRETEVKERLPKNKSPSDDRFTFQPTRIVAGGCFGPGIVRRVALQKWGEVPKEVCFRSLLQVNRQSVLPFLTNVTYSQIADEYDARRKQGGWNNLLDLLSRHKLTATKLDAGGLSPTQERRIQFEALIEAFRETGRRSSATLSWSPASVAEMIESISLACDVFNPSVVVKHSDSGSDVYDVQIGVEDRVYEFSFRPSRPHQIRPEPFCDILNHCLDRQGIQGRFVALRHSGGAEILFGKPELFAALKNRFGLQIPNSF